MNDLAIFAVTLSPTSVTAGVVTWAVTASNTAAGTQPNPLVGLRTKATKSSAEAWVAGHRAALQPAKVTMVVSLVVAVASLVCAVASFSGAGLALPGALLAGAAIVLVVAGCLWACWVADRAARGVRAVRSPAMS